MTRLLTSRPGWPEARARLAELHAKHGSEADQQAAEYAQLYEGRRGVMVVDVIASKQRRYETRVRGTILPEYEQRAGRTDLATLAGNVPTWLPLRRGEAQTMSDVAAGLLNWGREEECGNEEDAVRSWASATEEVRFAPRLDPYVGCQKGIGMALFAYLRMRSGADALKPDVRVHRGLAELGLELPSDAPAMLTAAEALADDLEVPRLVIDQLLWWR